MHFRSLLSMALLLFSLDASAGAERDSVIAADREFAAEAVESGQLSAYEQFLARDAVVFRPAAVNAQEWLSDHVPPTGRLSWTPAAAAVACDGSVAVTSGPWTYVDMDGRQTATGYYLTLWSKDENGDWRIALDHGIEVPQGAADASSVIAAGLARAWPDSGERQCNPRKVKPLEDAERSFNAAIGSDRRTGGRQQRNAGEVLAYRDGAAPSLVPVAELLRVESQRAIVRGQHVHAVTGSDMGYSYGELLQAGAEGAASSAVYVRLWQRAGREWQVVLELRSKLPEQFAAPSGDGR